MCMEKERAAHSTEGDEYEAELAAFRCLSTVSLHVYVYICIYMYTHM